MDPHAKKNCKGLKFHFEGNAKCLHYLAWLYCLLALQKTLSNPLVLILTFQMLLLDQVDRIERTFVALLQVQSENTGKLDRLLDL